MESLPNFKEWPIKYNDIIENGVMKFGNFCLPSLQYISSVRLVVHFWCEHMKDFEYLKHFQYQLTETTCYEVCQLGNEVVRKLDDIIKPKCLRGNISHLVLLIGKEICDWVTFYDYIFKTQYNNKGIAGKYVDKIVWSPRGSINHLETAKAMMSVTKLLPHKGCCLLCDACANSDVNLIGYPALKWRRMDYFFNDGNLNRRQQDFWEKYMHRSEEEFKKMQCMYCFEHEVSRFLRDIPVSEYKKDIYCLLCDLTIDYVCFFLSKLDKSQLYTWMKNGAFCYNVINEFMNKPSYLDYFLPVLYFLKNIITMKDFVRPLLFYLHLSIGSDDHKYFYEKYMFIFKELWSFLPEDEKDYILSYEFDWLWQRDSISMLGTFLAHSRLSFKRMLLFNSEASSFCEELIENGEWKMFEQYVCPVFFNGQDEETILLKRKFVHEMKHLFWYFIKQKLWKDLNRFFSWCYKDETVRTELKKMLIKDVFLQEVNHFMFTSKIYRGRAYNPNLDGVPDFTCYDDVLQWCFRTRKEIVDFKQTELCNTSEFTGFIREMIELERLDVIDMFLSWCFSNNKSLIKEYKENFGNQLTALEKYIASNRKRRRLR